MTKQQPSRRTPLHLDRARPPFRPPALPPDPLEAAHRRPADARGPRTMHAAPMLGLVVVTLALAAVLNARALVRDTERMPFGGERDVWLAVWRPFAWTADMTHLDEPREAVDRALGRGDGGADPAFVVAPPPAAPTAPPEQPAAAPTATAPTPVPPTPVPPLRQPTQTEPLRLWVGGDSLAGVFGESLVRLADDTGMIDGRVDYRISTGLARPDYFDWPGELARVARDEDPDVMVLVFGSNDPQGLLTPSGDVFQPLSDGWRAEYTRRVAWVMETVARPGRLVVWVGLPPMRDGELQTRLSDIDAIFRTEASRHDGVEYLDAAAILTENGSYTAYLDDGAGHVELVRESDGVHLTRAGGDRLAGAVLYEIASLVPLTPSVVVRY